VFARSIFDAQRSPVARCGSRLRSIAIRNPQSAVLENGFDSIREQSTLGCDSMLIARKSWLAVLILSSVAISVSCKAKLGSGCKPGKDRDVCADPTTALHCNADETYGELKCAGALGCMKLGAKINCDNTTAEADEACLNEGEEAHACSKSKKRALVCKGDKFMPYLECKGPKGCVMTGKNLACDNTIAERGDPCLKPGSLACSVDAKNRFMCKDGKWEIERYCRGRDACQVRMNDFFCDTSLSELNDPCGVAGSLVCDVDGTRQLICKGGKYTEDIPCKQGCAIMKDRKIDCRK
jgi:hypothetical protein